MMTGGTDATAPQAREEYLPIPKDRRGGIGLCLSGGGYRAALFHLGAMRRLNELGVLSKVATLSSVSGGSILAAHLADRLSPWPAPGTTAPDWDERVAAPFHTLTARNVRTGPVLRRLLPWNWLRTSTGIEALAEAFRDCLTRLTLRELPDAPRFVLCATDMAYGVSWVFERTRMGDYQVGYMEPPPEWPLARAVAASSCFPPVFNPLPMRVDPRKLMRGKAPPGPERDRCLSDLRLTDGGNYDNMGLEPVWKDHAVVLVSDGGATFDPSADKSLFWRLNRYVAIQGNQAAALRKRWLIAGFMKGVMEGTYWGVASLTANYDPAALGYRESTVKGVLAEVRTDMDAFSEGERKALENHGYLLCDVAIRRHAPLLIAVNAALKVPHPEWMDDERVRVALANSDRRKLLGRW